MNPRLLFWREIINDVSDFHLGIPSRSDSYEIFILNKRPHAPALDLKANGLALVEEFFAYP